MTYEDGRSTASESLMDDISKFTHDVEEKFQEVKEHMILTVERHSIVIAFVLMCITTVILVAGTVYVWIFHHHGNKYDDEPDEEETETEDGKTDASEIDNAKTNSTKVSKGRTVVQGTDTSDTDRSGEVRHRTTSRSDSINNNNDSPVKSKIPVRAKAKKS